MDCIKYIDGALYNLKHKTTAVPLKGAEENTIRRLAINSKIMKLRLQTKLRLQMCAMLSQINEYVAPTRRHKKAINNAKVAICTGQQLILETISLCELHGEKELEVSKSKSTLNKKLKKEVTDSYLVDKTSFIRHHSKKDITLSLDRLHTFNMKEHEETNANTNDEFSLVYPTSAFYFEESLPVVEKLINLHYPILRELARKLAVYEEHLNRTNDPKLVSMRGGGTV